MMALRVPSLLLLLFGETTALLIGPNATGPHRSLWDQEGFIDVGGDGTWHVWYDNDFCHDGTRGAGISNYGHLTSTDGVHWTDHGIAMQPWSVCPCGQNVLPKTELCATNATGAGPVAGIGSGSAWAVPGKKNKYVINYSTNKKNDAFGQEISFSTADSPWGPWVPATDVPAYHEDGTHFHKGRWDTIMQFTHDGVMHGWWTATPADGSVGFGYGTTTDGLHWTTEPPAKVNLHGLSGTQLEVGGVARLPNGKWYAHACATAWGHVDGLGGCFNVVSDGPGGPYNRTDRNWALLAYAAADGIPAYFSRPYLGPDGISLVNYIHVSTAGDKMSPLKHAMVDPSDGVTLHWVWWSGNDALKGAPQMQPEYNPDEEARTLVLEAARGSIVEGVLTWGADANTALVFSAPNSTAAYDAQQKGGSSNNGGGAGFLRLSAGNSTGQQPWSTLDLGKAVGESGNPIDSWANNSHQGITGAAAEPTRGLLYKTGDAVSWRLLYRQGLYEIYFAAKAAGTAAPTTTTTTTTTTTAGAAASQADQEQTWYFAAAYGADPTKVVSCVGGQKVDKVNIELHGAFARSTDVKAWGMTLDSSDYNTTCSTN